jgi:hypothetical protein
MRTLPLILLLTACQPPSDPPASAPATFDERVRTIMDSADWLFDARVVHVEYTVEERVSAYGREERPITLATLEVTRVHHGAPGARVEVHALNLAHQLRLAEGVEGHFAVSTDEAGVLRIRHSQPLESTHE